MVELTSRRTARRQTANGRAGTPIEKLLAEARLKLIETGTRNRLIHTPRGAKRSRALTITGNASDDVFANLVRENKPLPVLAARKANKERDGATPETPRLVTPRTGDPNGLQTSLPPELLHKRLHAMQRDAKTNEEERGVNVLFLALGFLRWYEDEKSDMPRDAPLILLPVYLGRDPKRSNFDLKLREEDIATNQALHERLRGDFGHRPTRCCGNRRLAAIELLRCRCQCGCPQAAMVDRRQCHRAWLLFLRQAVDDARS